MAAVSTDAIRAFCRVTEPVTVSRAFSRVTTRARQAIPVLIQTVHETREPAHFAFSIKAGAQQVAARAAWLGGWC